jgi:hypothetical protein
MKNTMYLLMILLMVAIGCENSTETKNTISGHVYYAESNEPAGSAKVYFGNDIGCMSGYVFEQYTFTNSLGNYSFEKPENTHLADLYAIIEFNNTSYVSPVQEYLVPENNDQVVVDDIFLYEVTSEYQIFGTLTDDQSVIIPDNLVKLYRLAEMEFVLIDSTFSNAEGNYNFSNVQTGNYRIRSSKYIVGFDYIGDTEYLFFSGTEDIDIPLELDISAAEKPVIYIYPEEAAQFQVNLIFKNNTILTESIPEYKNGWDVFAEKSGKIDNKYDYLFYETSMGSLPDLLPGWCIIQEDIKKELPKILHKLGLNEKETTDFMEYWIPRFNEHEFYNFNLLINEQLDNYVELDITPKPDSILRLLFFFEGCNEYEKLPTPRYTEFKRIGTTVVEWGGVMIN